MEIITGLQDWANDNSGLVTLVVGVLSLIAAVMVGAKARDGFPTWGERLQDRASWPLLIAKWRGTGGQSYDAAVAEITAFADGFYGPRPLSWRAFDRCLTLAFLYPIIALILGWALFNSHSPAGLALFIDDPQVWPRIGRTIVLILGLAVAMWTVANARRFAEFAVERIFGSQIHLLFLAGAYFLAFTSAIVVPYAVALTSASAVTVDVASVFSVFFVVCGAVGGSLSAARVFAGAIVIVGAVAVAVAVAGAGAGAFLTDSPEVAALLLLLYVFLPILNAVADWISLSITRRFLRTHPTGPQRALPLILLRAACDLALALVCLAGLLAVISFGLTLWGRASPATLPFTAADYMAQVIADPSQGTALYLMVATTLLPTFVHFLLGLGAVLSHRGALLSRVADQLDDKLAKGDPLLVEERHELVGQIRRARWVGYGGALVITSVIFALVIAPVYQLVF